MKGRGYIIWQNVSYLSIGPSHLPFIFFKGMPIGNISVILASSWPHPHALYFLRSVLPAKIRLILANDVIKLL